MELRELIECKKTERLDGSSWNILRKKILERDNYKCVHENCGKPASEVDHIKPKGLGGTDDESNLQSLCVECHKEKTHKTDRRLMNYKREINKQRKENELLGMKQ